MTTTKLEKLYPNHKILGLNEMLVGPYLTCPACWYTTLVTDKKDILAIAKRGTDAVGRNIRIMNLKLLSPNGTIRNPDFKPSEII